MKILDPGHDPILGRLHGFNRKHRLRTKHYAEIEDFPPDGSFDVLDPSRLGAVDFYTNEDQLFVVSEKLCTVLETLEPIVKHAVDAGGTTVYVIEPVSDDDVMYASDGFPPYSKSGRVYRGALHPSSKLGIAAYIAAALRRDRRDNVVPARGVGVVRTVPRTPLSDL